MRLSRAPLEKAIPSAAIFAFFFVFCALKFLGSKSVVVAGVGRKKFACLHFEVHPRAPFSSTREHRGTIKTMLFRT